MDTLSIDRLDNDILSRFEQLVQRCAVIRTEKVWKNFKLRDAEFHLREIKETSNALFHPLITFYEFEIKCLRWVLCPDDILLHDVETTCIQLSKSLRTITKQLDKLSHTANKAGKVFIIEYQLMESEVMMIQAALDFNSRNYITAAHTLAKSNELFLHLAQVIDETRGKSEEALQTNGFISLCQSALHSNGTVPKDLLANLQQMIDEKTSDIRRRHKDRRAAVPEDILEATRSLLQLKQLYADLSGKWRSSDGHSESQTTCDNKENTENVLPAQTTEKDQVSFKKPPLSPKRSQSKSPVKSPSRSSVKSPKRSSTAMYTPKKSTVERDSDDEEDTAERHELDDDFENSENINVEQQEQPAKTRKPRVSLSPKSKVQEMLDNSPLRKPRSPMRPMQTRHLEARTAIESPQKMSFASVTSILPRVFNFGKFLSHNATQQAQIMKPLAQRKMSVCENGGAQQQAKRKASISQYAHDVSDCAIDVEIDCVDFKQLFDSCGSDDFCEQQLVKALSRVHFAIALRNLLFAHAPKQLKWMLSLLSLVPNVTQSLVTLFQIHNFEEGYWGPVCTLILLNLPANILQNAMQECDSATIAAYLPIQSWEQLHPLLEAQSMLASWTSKNPLWLSTIARSASANICTNAMTRLDFYRRCLAAEADTFASSGNSSTSVSGTNNSAACPYAFCSVRAAMAKHFLALGHWTKAYNAGRTLFQNPIAKRNVQLEALAVQIAAASAASCLELFGHQNKYLHVKFADHLILNTGSAAMAAAGAGTEVDEDKQAGQTKQRVVCFNMDCNAFYQSGVRDYLGAFYTGGMGLTLHTSSSTSASATSNGKSDGSQQQQQQQLAQFAEHNLRGRLLHYHQLLTISEEVEPWRDDAEALVRAAGAWLWLLPLEFLYLHAQQDSSSNEAMHNQMLQLCDKGAVLFADRYLNEHLLACLRANRSHHQPNARSNNFTNSNTNNHDYDQEERHQSNRTVLGPLVKAIVLEKATEEDQIAARNALVLIKKMTVLQETNLFTGATSMRIAVDDSTGIIAHSAFEQLMLALNPSKHEALKAQEVTAARRCVKKIESRLEKIKQSMLQQQQQQQSVYASSGVGALAQQYLLDAPRTVDSVMGDVVVTFLLIRGLILRKLQRIWEAVTMFKLIDVLKESAPRSKFAVFAAYTELAEIVMDYDVCEEPLILSAEYLKRGCVALRRAFDSGYLPYVHEYRRKQQALAERLRLTTIV